MPFRLAWPGLRQECLDGRKRRKSGDRRKYLADADSLNPRLCNVERRSQTHANADMANQLEPAEVSVACDGHDAIFGVLSCSHTCLIVHYARVNIWMPNKIHAHSPRHRRAGT